MPARAWLLNTVSNPLQYGCMTLNAHQGFAAFRRRKLLSRHP
jgi:hypothetical protein